MGRKKRKFDTGGIYHIVQRGHNKSFIFKDLNDKAYFLALLHAARETLSFNLLYYVLMDNHFHLIVQMDSDSISRVIRDITLAYSKYYNNRHHHKDTVYSQRFRAYHVHDRSYFLNLVLYIAYNPVKAGIVAHPSEYIWGAHLDILTKRTEFLAINRLFELLCGDSVKGFIFYQKLINHEIIPLSNARTDNEFLAERIADQLHNIMNEMINSRTPIEQIQSTKHDTKEIQIRREFIRLANEKGYKSTEIAKFLNLSQQCVRHYISHA